MVGPIACWHSSLRTDWPRLSNSMIGGHYACLYVVFGGNSLIVMLMKLFIFSGIISYRGKVKSGLYTHQQHEDYVFLYYSDFQ